MQEWMYWLSQSMLAKTTLLITVSLWMELILEVCSLHGDGKTNFPRSILIVVSLLSMVITAYACNALLQMSSSSETYKYTACSFLKSFLLKCCKTSLNFIITWLFGGDWIIGPLLSNMLLILTTYLAKI